MIILLYSVHTKMKFVFMLMANLFESIQDNLTCLGMIKWYESVYLNCNCTLVQEAMS